MDRLWTIALKELRTRFTDRNLLLIMLAAPLAISTIIGLAFGGMGRTASPISGIPVAVIDFDQLNMMGVSYGAMLASLLTEGQLPSGTMPSSAGCPQAASEAGAAGGMTLGELIHGSTFDTTAAQRLIDEQTIVSPPAAASSPDYLEAAARAAVDKGAYDALVVIPADFSAALASLSDPRSAPGKAAITIYGNAG
jgi:ABC-type Na+ efflux pump permease subunit